MKTVALLVARMGSGRLPGKAMAEIEGTPMLKRLVERTRASDSIDEIVITTSTLEKDDVLEELAKTCNVSCFRGSPDDVLGRITGAANQFNADIVVELLGDNPLLHSDLIDDVLDMYKDGDYDYVANVTNEYPYAPEGIKKFPIGIRIQAIAIEALRKCESLASTDEYREHSTNFMFHHPEIFKIGYLPAEGKWSGLVHPTLTFAVNYHENFQMITEIFKKGLADDPNFDLNRVMEIYLADPSLAKLMGNNFEPYRK